MLLTKEVKTKWVSTNRKHYESFGYKYVWRGELIVLVEHLTESSHVLVDIQCDYCGKVTALKWQDYNHRNTVVDKDCCKDCWYLKCSESNLKVYGVKNQFQRKETTIKIKDTNLKKYGVEHPMQDKDYNNKVKKSNLDKYGYENVGQIPEVKDKIIKTQIEKYGSLYSQTEESKEKYKATCREKYGVDNAFQAKEVKEKIVQFNLNTYGFDHPMKLESIKKDRMNRMFQTQNKNSTFQSSKQQNYLHTLFGGKLNYPVDRCVLDICFIDKKLYIEYDGSGHELSVQFGDISREDFDRKESNRKYYLRNLGWKEIRIISKNDFLPSDKILINMFNIAEAYFKLEHSWIKYDIDSKKIITSRFEKDFDFKELRKIK